MIYTIDFTKETICLMVISSLDNNNVNDLELQIIFYKLQNIFDELYC